MIRRAGPDDAAAIAEIYRPHVETGTASFERDAPDATEITRRMATAGDDYPWLVAAEDDVLGYAYASAHRTRHAYRWSVDTAIYVAPRAQGRGVAKALYGCLLATLTRQNFAMAFAGITLPNEASLALHGAMGFEKIARYPKVGYKQGAWRDTEWWARPLAEQSTPPQELLPVPGDLARV